MMTVAARLDDSLMINKTKSNPPGRLVGKSDK